MRTALAQAQSLELKGKPRLSADGAQHERAAPSKARGRAGLKRAAQRVALLGELGAAPVGAAAAAVAAAEAAAAAVGGGGAGGDKNAARVRRHGSKAQVPAAKVVPRVDDLVLPSLHSHAELEDRAGWCGAGARARAGAKAVRRARARQRSASASPQHKPRGKRAAAQRGSRAALRVALHLPALSGAHSEDEGAGDEKAGGRG